MGLLPFEPHEPKVGSRSGRARRFGLDSSARSCRRHDSLESRRAIGKQLFPALPAVSAYLKRLSSLAVAVFRCEHTRPATVHRALATA